MEPFISLPGINRSGDCSTGSKDFVDHTYIDIWTCQAIDSCRLGQASTYEAAYNEIQYLLLVL